MKLKVCGMKYPGNITAVSELLPDYIGFIFWEKSARFFDGELPEIPPSIKKVGVFVDASTEAIYAKIEKYQLDAIQLHGNESPDYCKALQSHNIQVIKVFSVTDDFDFSILQPYEPVCDFFLFDTKGQLPGGNGVVFNWELLAKYPSQKPFFLSGGIGSDAIDKIKKLQLPIYAIDINSKFETEPGLKDPKLIQTVQYHLKSQQ